jgi:lysophospholipase L1-like esterase
METSMTDIIERMVIGDSIAYGIWFIRRDCIKYADAGLNSQQWSEKYLSEVASVSAKLVIISLGANDHDGIQTELELRKIRKSINANKVFWISPGAERKPIPQSAIERISEEYGDTIIPRPADHMSPDGVHPTDQGYRILGEQAQ